MPFDLPISLPLALLLGVGILVVVSLLVWLLRDTARLVLATFALTLFLSASLLFLVQPLVGKLLLPFMGGSPAVWNTCMVFFQALLLAGYAYAHLLTRLKDPRKQIVIHGFVLLLPLLPLFLFRYFDIGIVADYWPAPSEANPIPWLLMVLLITAGLPFFAVSATAPLLQKWFSNTAHPDAKDPYFLYGASNVGSMGALLLYPAVVEWTMKLSQQRMWWAFCYLGLAALILAAGALALLLPARRTRQPAGSRESGVGSQASGVGGQTPDAASAAEETGRIPTWFDRVRWVLLAFVPSSVMLGCTTYMTTDIAPVPLLWILPLALYLASFILVFSRLPLWLSMCAALLLPVVIVGWLTATSSLDFTSWGGFYESSQTLLNMPLPDMTLHHLLVLALGGILVACCFRTPRTIHTLMVVLAPLAGLAIAFEWELRNFLTMELRPYEWLLLHLGVLFVVAMVCHGELARTRPRTRYLTEFYLLMSLGGVLGGMFNTLLAPVVYDRVWEYPLVVAFMLLLMPWPGSEDEKGWDAADSWTVAVFGAGVGVLLLTLFVARVTVEQRTALDWVQEHVSPRWQPAAVFLAHQLNGDEVTNELLRGDWLRSTKVLLRERNFFGTFTVVKVVDKQADRIPGDRVEDFTKACARQWLAVGQPDVSGLLGTNLLASQQFAAELAKPRRVEYVYHKMFHGTTTHGMELMATNDAAPINRVGDPLTYFHRTGPIGDIFRDRARRGRPLKMAVIGVGTGTLAAYSQKGWAITLFDIDPAVVRVAQDTNYFTYLSGARERGATIDVILGDGRQQFKKAADGQFDLIFVDAFTSDAVPVHLLTQEAAEMYAKKLAPGGAIVFNIANRYLDFEPILGNLCATEGWSGIVGRGPQDLSIDRYGSAWVMIGKNEADLGMLPYRLELTDDGDPHHRWKKLAEVPSKGVWTDDYANLLSVFQWRE